jgi:hypothetical protein
VEKATGELIDTETVTISSEEGRWKRAERYLAGGLSYRKPGAKRGLRHEVVSVIVVRDLLVMTQPAVPSAVSYEDVREGNDSYRAFGQ